MKKKTLYTDTYIFTSSCSLIISQIRQNRHYCTSGQFQPYWIIMVHHFILKQIFIRRVGRKSVQTFKQTFATIIHLGNNPGGLKPQNPADYCRDICVIEKKNSCFRYFGRPPVSASHTCCFHSLRFICLSSTSRIFLLPLSFIEYQEIILDSTQQSSLVDLKCTRVLSKTRHFFCNTPRLKGTPKH